MSLEFWDTVIEDSNDKGGISYTKDSRVTRDEDIKRNNLFHKKHPKSIEYYKNLSNIDNNATIGEQLSLRNDVKEKTPVKVKKEKVAKSMSQASLMFMNLVKKHKRNSIFLLNEKSYEGIKVFKHYNVEILNQKDKPVRLSVNACIGEWTDF